MVRWMRGTFEFDQLYAHTGYQAVSKIKLDQVSNLV